jgi:hypothetical protein
MLISVGEPALFELDDANIKPIEIILSDLLPWFILLKDEAW